MDNYGQNHLFFYQDFLYATEHEDIKNLMVELRSLEKQRLSFLEDEKELAFFESKDEENELLYLLLYKVFFHLFYLKLRHDKNEEFILIEEKIYHKIKAYLYLHQVRAPILLFPNYCLNRISEPLNDLLLFLVKLLMTGVYFLFGWTGWLKQCIR